jgi:hypothetical protein
MGEAAAAGMLKTEKVMATPSTMAPDVRSSFESERDTRRYHPSAVDPMMPAAMKSPIAIPLVCATPPNQEGIVPVSVQRAAARKVPSP